MCCGGVDIFPPNKLVWGRESVGFNFYFIKPFNNKKIHILFYSNI